MTNQSSVRSLRRLRAKTGYLFIVPWVAGFVLFKFIPIIASLVLSLTNFHMLEPAASRFIGFDNYVSVFNDPSATSTLYASLSYALISIPLQVVCAIALAAILTSQRLRGRSILRSLFFVPSIIPATAIIFLWSGFLSPSGGWLNPILEWLHLPAYQGPATLADGNLLRAVQALWGIGPGFLIMLGAIQSVPSELYEASKLDGAGPIVRLFKITLPILKPAVGGALFYIFIEAIRNVDVAVLLTAPGLEYGPVTLFEYFRVGQWAEAAAGGVIYLIILIVAVSVAKFAFKMKFSL